MAFDNGDDEKRVLHLECEVRELRQALGEVVKVLRRGRIEYGEFDLDAIEELLSGE